MIGGAWKAEIMPVCRPGRMSVLDSGTGWKPMRFHCLPSVVTSPVVQMKSLSARRSSMRRTGALVKKCTQPAVAQLSTT